MKRLLLLITIAAACDRAPSVIATAALDPTTVKYRFSLTTADEGTELVETIRILGERHRAAPSPIDAAELADAHYRRAQRTGDRADYAAAEQYATESLAILRKPNGALVTLAKLKNARHEFREAIALAEEHLASKPGPGAFLVVATARLALGDLDEALVATERALAIRPDTNGHATRALVMQAMGRDDEAAASFARAVAHEQAGDREGAARLRALWARFLVRRGEHASATLVIDEALRIAPEYPLALAQRGEMLIRTGKPADAAKVFERAFQLSREVRFLMDEARARELAGKRELAATLRAQIESMVRAELATNERGHTIDLVEVLVDRGTPEGIAEAVKVGRAELARRASFDVRFQLARALYRAGELEEAARLVDETIASGAREAQLFELAARIAKARGRTDEARVLVTRADEIDPMNKGWRALGMESK